MKRLLLILPCSLMVLLGLFSINYCSTVGKTTSEMPEVVDFNLHIKPILSDRCFKCHGPDKNQQQANLALHTEELAFAELTENPGHFAIVPGDPKNSELMKRITEDDPTLLMPPPESNLTLNEYEIALMRKWIEQGAPWKDHWAFIPPQKPDVPKSDKEHWAQNTIDHFILAKLDQLGVPPASPATKEALLRRVSFDLTGLPPTPETIEQFLADDSPNAYERIVDQLLASTAYGERMAIDWLDVARYADSHGYQDDRPRTMWPWRDWVIRAFNSNMPYDQFVTWQLAGDLLPSSSYEQKLATGFNRNHAITQEGGVVDEEYLTEYAADRTQTFATAFLGLTMECARCHDHKYDPISQEDYYSLFSFFNNIKEERGKISYYDKAPVPNMVVQDADLTANIEEVKSMIDQLENEKEKLKNNKSKDFEEWSRSANLKDVLHQSIQDHRIAYCTLDETDGNPFVNLANPSIETGLNINLPPEIEAPVRTVGFSGQALQFNGANHLSIGDIGDFEHYDDFSIGGRIKHSGKHEKDAGIISRRNGELQRQGYDLSLSKDNRLRMRLIGERNHLIIVENRKRLKPNTWYHVMVTYDGSGVSSGVKIYIDGETGKHKVIEDNLDKRSLLNGNNLLVGNWNHRAVNLKDLYGFAGGTVDEVLVFDRQLSPVEITYIANGESLPKQPSSKDLFLHYLIQEDLDFDKLRKELKLYRRHDLDVPSVMIMEEMDTVKATYILARGAYDAPTTPVERKTPVSILDFPENLPKNRLGLARWLFTPENPLTARVYVNRLWQMLFGKGLVSTTEDFGSQGNLPTHPQLLDWLAVEFRNSDWNIKSVLKTMVMSATYRQSALITPDKYQIDPQNEWYARGPSSRLTAEMLRDQALTVSELLHPQVGGKWVKPYQPAGVWKELANQIGENKYRQSYGRNLYRRSLYTYWKRTIPPPTMVTLDAPERAVCTVKRQVTSTPLQSLILLNDPQYVEAARVLAENLIQDSPQQEPQYWIRKAAKGILSRELKAPEEALLLDLYHSEAENYQQKTEDGLALLDIGNTPNLQSGKTATVAALAVVVNTIFNMDEAKFK